MPGTMPGGGTAVVVAVVVDMVRDWPASPIEVDTTCSIRR